VRQPRRAAGGARAGRAARGGGADDPSRADGGGDGAADAIVGALDAQEYADFSEAELRTFKKFLQRVLAAIE